MIEEAVLWLTSETHLLELLGGFSTVALLGIMIVCILVLGKGADLLIDGVVTLASRTGLPKIVIGATIVSVGTTLPEAFVSVMAAWMGNPGLALGNGVGSIIVDTGLIFGVTCMISVVPVNRFILTRTGWVQVGVATLLVVISLVMLIVTGGQPVLHRWVGVFFLILLGIYMWATYRWAREGKSMMEEEDTDSHVYSLPLCYLMIAAGLVMIVIGARILIPSASCIAARIGVPDDVIAATMVAFGTSLPELITAVTAVRRGHPEIAVGNIVGADVLNCLFVIGAAAAVRPLEIPRNFYLFHFPAMLIILYFFRFSISRSRKTSFKRRHGVVLFSIYLIYLLLQYVFNVGTVH